ncbi:nucleoside triphosphate pyrophosphatase [Sphingomonas sp.]|uniref:Maf family protein n=1 Tax=Sphingomonas sp. TaxID=28214 RepID=UPI00286D2782|nr:nucleoside triphosphate pyrophosphatase [Sphingomonas sp.]
MRIVLASSSAIRQSMLAAAGVDFDVASPQVDEAALKAAALLTDDLAADLAQAKALSISQARVGDWVIGSDSVVSVQGRQFDKPIDRSQAAEHLQFFSGKTIQLTSAVALARGNAIEWTHAQTAALEVRSLSEAFIAGYLDAEWPAVGHCVGAFRMEGRGVQLFSSIEGDHFTILGMPLIPLLGALRDRGALPA